MYPIETLKKTLSIRLTQKERDCLEKLAKENAMKKGEYIRYLIRKEEERTKNEH